MKKLSAFLSILFFLASCSHEITRFAYVDNPLKYKDIKTNGELVIQGKFAYMETIQGTPMVVDLDVFTIQRINGKLIKPIPVNLKSDTTIIKFKESTDVVVINYSDLKTKD